MANKLKRQAISDKIENTDSLFRKVLSEKTNSIKKPQSKEDKRRSVLNKILPLIPEDRKNTIINWIPAGKSETTIFKSMLQRAIFKYKVPPFFYTVFSNFSDPTYYQQWRPLVINVGLGASAFKEFKNILPDLTRAQAHKLMCSQEHTPIKAYYRIISEEVGLSIGFLNEVEQNYKFSNTPARYLIEILTWVSRNQELTKSEIGPICDYLRVHRPNQLLKRTVKSLRRAMEDWHTETFNGEKIKGIPEQFPNSGFKNWVGTVESDNGVKLSAQVFEILTYTNLIKEGKDLKHCVASYADSVANKRVSIWSLLIDGGYRVTIEVSNQEKTVRQARGKYNRVVNRLERGVMNGFAKMNGLKISTYV